MSSRRLEVDPDSLVVILGLKELDFDVLAGIELSPIPKLDSRIAMVLVRD